MRYITQRFRGKVIGTQNRAYVDKRAANEFAHPANHSLNEKIYELTRTATELDNLMDAGRYIGHFEDNGRHADALGGWDCYEAIVKVNDAFYEGQINIMILGDGRRRFHDFTKIRDVSAALQDCNALRRDNVSDNSISKTAENSNTNKNFSLKNVDTDMTEMQRVVEENENGGTMGALEGATVESHAGIYAAQREKLAGWSDGKPRSAKAVRELLEESMTPTLEKWLHNQYEKGRTGR